MLESLYPCVSHDDITHRVVRFEWECVFVCCLESGALSESDGESGGNVRPVMHD